MLITDCSYFIGINFSEVDKFPSLERERTVDGSNSIERTRNASKLTDHNHNREVIFALPSMQLHLKTEHLQSSNIPDISGKHLNLNYYLISIIG